jgi:hypothetical protein
MLIVDKIIVSGVSWVLDKLCAAIEAEHEDPTALREELLAAQMRAELGELSPEELAAIEERVMTRLRELRPETQQRALGGLSMAGGQTGVEVDVDFGHARPASDGYVPASDDEPAPVPPTTPARRKKKTKASRSGRKR